MIKFKHFVEEVKKKKKPGDLLRTNTPGNANVYRMPVATTDPDETSWRGAPEAIDYIK